jgi:serine/threonine-protein kinase RsbT
VSLHIPVNSELDVARVIAASMHFCADQGLGELFAAHVATAASELANNLWMHTSQGGTVALSMLQVAERRGVELVAQDEGPGIADIPLALSEGYSTGGGLGCGLPGVQRLMDDFEINSTPGLGTRIVARKWQRS